MEYARPRPAPVPAFAIAPARLVLAALTIAAWLSALAGWLWLALQMASALRGGQIDFPIFHDAGIRARLGLDLYAAPLTFAVPHSVAVNVAPNLNHPIVALAFIPLGLLPLPVAYVAWAALCVACYAVAATLVARESRPHLPARARSLVAALVAGNAAVLLSIGLGQLTAPLTLGIVAAWLLLRRDRMWAAGALLGTLVALKFFLLPLLALFVLRRCWRGLAGAAVGALGLSALALPFVGVAGFRGWLAALGTVTWYDSRANISLVGVAYRALHAPPHLLVSAIAVGIPLAGCGALLLRRHSREAGDDRDLAALLVLGLLACPLGWLYYLPLLLPVAAILARRWHGLPTAARVAALAAAVAIAVPFPAYDNGLALDLQTAALLALLPALLIPAPSSP